MTFGTEIRPGSRLITEENTADQPDNSVVAVQVGFSTNLTRLLHSAPDQYSPLDGLQLVRQKVKLLSITGGAFAPIRGKTRSSEYNIRKDIFSAKGLVENWPVQMVFSGFEIGLTITYPHRASRETLVMSNTIHWPRLTDFTIPHPTTDQLGI